MVKQSVEPNGGLLIKRCRQLWLHAGELMDTLRRALMVQIAKLTACAALMPLSSTAAAGIDD
ncbi:hypothetical protein ABA45_01380 [Marinobacter psychrophilus]|uniref:Uncharacterized protein n=1 Tax=Marinobacter psychrophilus TaxID=330734 RepID=A0A0H4I075_9GAMM|nr:hypothetical protein [Marinobacter psychrophilus]AKO51243.1 hypothetical protein ABA45_01380 [Marinobacter psychrophilus]